MVSKARERMVESAVVLLAQRGLQATSFADVLAKADAPRGSIYHHFPEGKDQLVDAALGLAGSRALTLLDSWSGEPAAVVTANFLSLWRTVLDRSSFSAGCSVLAVTVATDSPALLDHSATIFRDWRAKLAQLLEQGGLSAAEAQGFAATLVAASEGAVVMSRAEKSMVPFDLVAQQLLDSLG